MTVAGLSTTLLLLGAVSPPTVLIEEATDGGSLKAETEFITAINEFREEDLIVDADLSQAARRWAEAIATSGLSHSDLEPLLDGWDLVGENIGQGSSVERIFTALVDSPSHRANMADSRFTHVGVGVHIDEEGIMWTAHLFAGGPRQTYRTPASGP